MVDSLLFFLLCGLGLLAIIGLLGILLWWVMTGRDHRRRKLGVMLVLGIVAIGVVILGVFVVKPPVEKDVFLEGGYSYTLQVREKINDNGLPIGLASGAIDQVIDTFKARLDQVGYHDVLIQKLDSDRIRIDVYGAEAKEAHVIERLIAEPSKLELRLVHPESSSQAADVKAGMTVVPGFTHYEYRFTADDGQERTEDLLLSKRVQVEGKHVRYASPDAGQQGVVNIRLNSEGGDRMIRLTKDLTPRRDRIAVVLDDEIMSAPVVNAVPLGSSFIIEGLGSYEEASDLSASLMNPLEHPVKILEFFHVSAGETEVNRANLASGSPRRLKRTVGIILGLGVVGLGVAMLGVFALSSKRGSSAVPRTPDRAPNQSPPPIPRAAPPRDPD